LAFPFFESLSFDPSHWRKPKTRTREALGVDIFSECVAEALFFPPNDFFFEPDEEEEFYFPHKRLTFPELADSDMLSVRGGPSSSKIVFFLFFSDLRPTWRVTTCLERSFLGCFFL